MIRAARKYGDEVVVILNNDHWLRGKKGFAFMPEKERAELCLAMGADRVYLTKHRKGDPDRSVCKALRALKPDVFCNGGDRKGTKDIPEAAVCAELGIKMVFNVGKGGKIQSSSWLVDAVVNALKLQGLTRACPWGSQTLFAQGKNFWVKTLTIKKGHRTSLQKHLNRGELWMCIDGSVEVQIGKSARVYTIHPYQEVKFPANTIHRISSKSGGTIIEIGYGAPEEADNIRYEDDYGRI